MENWFEETVTDSVHHRCSKWLRQPPKIRSSRFLCVWSREAAVTNYNQQARCNCQKREAVTLWRMRSLPSRTDPINMFGRFHQSCKRSLVSLPSLCGILHQDGFVRSYFPRLHLDPRSYRHSRSKRGPFAVMLDLHATSGSTAKKLPASSYATLQALRCVTYRSGVMVQVRLGPRATPLVHYSFSSWL